MKMTVFIVVILIIWVIVGLVLLYRRKNEEQPKEIKEEPSPKEIYSNKLQDPRWQEKRKYILERDNYACKFCGSHHNLQVHHYYYICGKEPWEYNDKALVTLCKNCHTWWHKTHKYKIYGNR